ncbi:MAG TPA: fluoride efflux transporter CrcB [Microbacteriaceae bacterium]|nr:fluoride efflux transporter CrcB [Microbacteriaceae bacterium]
MTPVVFVGVCLAGGLGAAARFLLDGWVKARLRVPYPVGTTVINVAGSLVLGAVTGAGLALLPGVAALVGGGFCGGFTTFSTASVETVRLVQDRRWLAGLGNGVGMLVLAVAAALLGLWLGRALA